jgi:hypothetical protein
MNDLSCRARSAVRGVYSVTVNVCDASRPVPRFHEYGSCVLCVELRVSISFGVYHELMTYVCALL